MRGMIRTEIRKLGEVLVAQGLPTIEEIEGAIDYPTDRWPSNCYAVSNAIVEAGLVEGRAVYGHYYGPICPESSFFNTYLQAGWVRHGWIILEDGQVLDPTRWVFECVEPYLWVGPDDDYDEGGQTLKDILERPMPPYTTEESLQTRVVVPIEEVPPRVSEFLETEFGAGVEGGGLTAEQGIWIGSLSLNRLGDYAKDVYSMLEGVGFKAFVPIDNWNREMR